MYNATAETFARDVAVGMHVVMFHAAWCGPCKSMKPLVEQLAAELGFSLIGVDVGEQRELAVTHAVRAVPTIIVLRDGLPQSTIAGGVTEGRLRSFLAAAGVPA